MIVSRPFHCFPGKCVRVGFASPQRKPQSERQLGIAQIFSEPNERALFFPPSFLCLMDAKWGLREAKRERKTNSVEAVVGELFINDYVRTACFSDPWL